MKKTVLVALNAKYIHSNLGVHSISQYGKQRGVVLEVKEYTINQAIDDIMSDIYDQMPDVIGLSCYIWNIEMIRQMIPELRKVLPNAVIVLGGPEVSYEVAEWFERLPQVSYIINGEGEAAFTDLIQALEAGKTDLRIPGISTKDLISGPRTPLSMDDLPFIYEAGLEDYAHRIMYYETSRGCPFNCQYCLSSIEKGLRFRSMDLVVKELQFFLDNQVQQVKFVDRTFNADRKRTEAIWHYIIDHDNGITNFHFEIAADLLTDSAIEVLGKARPGLVQLEIGVQSTHHETLNIIKRITQFDQLTDRVQKIQNLRNTHIHLDLIAGLPEENYAYFRQSFNDVYDLKPDQLQLGFLKVLRGSGMKDMVDQYGLAYRDYAPYEILFTNVLTFGEMEQLKALEHVLEIYYNSGYYKHTIGFLAKYYETPFDLYEALGIYYKSVGGHLLKHAKLSLYSILRDFGRQVSGIETEVLDGYLTFDLLLQEKIKKYPEWYQPTPDQDLMSRNFFIQEGRMHQYLPHLSDMTGKQLSRTCHLQVFYGDMISTLGYSGDDDQVLALFDYSRRSPLNNEPEVSFVELQACLTYSERQD